MNLTTILTFGTFDHIHPGHHHYLTSAKAQGGKLITIIARDSSVEKIKKFVPDHPENERRQMVADLGIADEVVLGDTDDHLRCIHQYRPDIIYLWYDHHVDDSYLETYCRSLGLPTKIMRGKAFHPEIYKSSLVRKKLKEGQK